MVGIGLIGNASSLCGIASTPDAASGIAVSQPHLCASTTPFRPPIVGRSSRRHYVQLSTISPRNGITDHAVSRYASLVLQSWVTMAMVSMPTLVDTPNAGACPRSQMIYVTNRSLAPALGMNSDGRASCR